MRRLALVLVGGILAGAGCGGSDPPPIQAADEVWMQNTTFQPTTRTVTVGTTVRFVNQDGQVHNVSSSTIPAGASAFNNNVAASATANIAFTVAGTYQYFCNLHGTISTGMRGTVIVN